MRQTITVLGYLLGYLLTALLLAIWFVAYLHGGSVTVTINEFGEMYPELVMWVLVTAVMTVGLDQLISNE